MKILKVIVKNNVNHFWCPLFCKSNIYGFCCVPVVHGIRGLTDQRQVRSHQYRQITRQSEEEDNETQEI